MCEREPRKREHKAMRGHLRPVYRSRYVMEAHHERRPGPLTRFWRDLTGADLREDHRALARRVAELEKANKPAPPHNTERAQRGASLEAASEPADLAALQRMLAIIKIVQQQTTERLNELAAAVETSTGEGRDALVETRALQDALSAQMTAWEQQLAAFPEQWRADLEARIEALRETPDAANAALLGVAAFTKSISAQLREER